ATGPSAPSPLRPYARAYTYRGLPASCFALPWRAAEVYATEVAREHAQRSIEELDREIDSLLFETRVRKEVVSDTVATLLKRAAARRNASMTVPQASPIDPRPLTNGRVQ
ncbi:MAG: hypothetical protein U9Q81_14025, partial [Pseudomonadota bacterium]|nr:hypothetical protein [Pseudomonadota bacterium]